MLGLFPAVTACVGSGAAIAPWTPLELGVLVAAWWDSSETSTITQSAGIVSVWASKVGSQVANQPSAPLRPSYSPNTDGFPSINFSAAQSLQFTGTSFPLGPSASTMAVVATSNLSASNYWAIFYGSSPAGQQRGILANGGPARYSIGATGSSSSSPWNISRVQIGVTPQGFGQQMLYSDGITGTSDPSATPATPSTAGFIGAGSGGASNWSGPIREILVISSELTADTRQKLEGYLAWKWGTVANLPANHPYKNSPPTV